MTTNYAVGIDVGGTKINITIVDSEGHIHFRERFQTVLFQNPDNMIAHFVSVIRALEQKKPISAIGIGIAGQVSSSDGAISSAPNLGWVNVPLKAKLSQALAQPIVIVNDVRAATYGEWIHGEGKGCDDLLCLFFGTGIGGGIISKGQMIEGDNNSAGEAGHMIVDINGPFCTCGSQGCWEALAGGWAITKRAQQLVEADMATGAKLLELAEGFIGSVTTHTVAEGCKIHDPLALQIANEMAQAITAGCIGLVNLLNPKKLLLGGGMIEGFPFVLEKVQKGIDKYALKSAKEKLNVLNSKLSYDACPIGAATLALHRGREMQ